MRPDEMKVISALLKHALPAEPSLGRTSQQVLVWERRHQGLGGFVLFSFPHDSVHSISCIEELWVASYLRDAGVEAALLNAIASWRAFGDDRAVPAPIEIAESRTDHASEPDLLAV